ncbi:diguanylate cyclase [Candidatus Poribacteria bacterium]|nr:diguanylate cyclase [Candidatus Poribacteria bacterium]MEE2909999.1 RraA family protein [Candidatus Poribacteria bacterium]|tara:strand:- start:1147 stop:1773 length:627 start_codon:yes stop_codon:yes gene_type:complete
MKPDQNYCLYSPTDYAEALPRSQFMDFQIKPLWSPIPRISGAAFTVKLAPSDNLMLHAAIYQAPPGSVIVVEAGDTDFAVAGGNVCAIAQKKGICGLVIDGVIRDLAEIREAQFPVFARGVMPIPGQKNKKSPLNIKVNCGGIDVSPNDIVVADEEGIAVIPNNQRQEIYIKTKLRAESDASTSLHEWEEKHYEKIQSLLKKSNKTDH